MLVKCYLKVNNSNKILMLYRRSAGVRASDCNWCRVKCGVELPHSTSNAFRNRQKVRSGVS